MNKDKQKELIAKLNAASAMIHSSYIRNAQASYIAVRPGILKIIQLYEAERQRKIRITERVSKIDALLGDCQ